MENKNYPRLLTISVNAWSDTKSTGNTFSNFFGNWDNEKLANLYLRDEVIDNKCCSKYFRITEKDIFNSLFYGKDLGNEIAKDLHSKSVDVKYENLNKIRRFVNSIKKMRPVFILLLRELVWAVGFKKKNKLNDFLDEFKPDIIYMHCHSLIYAHRVLKYCHKYTKAKVVIFFGDEVYSYKSVLPLNRLYQFILRFWIRKTLNIAEIQFGGSSKLCDYYTVLFRKEFKLLIKGIKFVQPMSKNYKLPLKIVYTGNLLFGRWIPLSHLAKAIQEISINENLFKLEIYSNTPLSKEMQTKLNTDYSTYMGPASYDDVTKHLYDADIVLHVESFRKRDISITKYSFSTKIIDCIQSGTCILGIGPSEISSMDFLKKSDSAIIVNQLDLLSAKLNSIVTDTRILNIYSIKMYNFAKDKFDLKMTRDYMLNNMLELIDR